MKGKINKKKQVLNRKRGELEKIKIKVKKR